MKKMFSQILALVALSFAPIASADTTSSQSFVSAPTQASPVIVDAWGDAADGIAKGAGNATSAAKHVTDLLQNLLMDWRTGGKVTLKVADYLESHGFPSGRVVQASILKKAGKALEKLGWLIDGAIAVKEISTAIAKGDKAAFQKAVTDFIINATAKIVGQVVSKVTFGFLTGATVGWGALPAWALGTALGMGSEALVKKLLNNYARDSIENLLGRAWDRYHGTSNGNGSGNAGNGGGGGGGGTVTPGDLEGLGDGDTSPGTDKLPGKKSGYQGIKGLKAHQWGGGGR